MYTYVQHVCVYMSRKEQNEHARSSGWLCGAGVPGGAAGREDRGTHHLLQPKRDEADEGTQLVFDWTVCRSRVCNSLMCYVNVIILTMNSP